MSRVLVDFGPSNTGLQPAFVVFADLYALTTVLAAPVVYEIGGGAYYFDVVFPLAASSTTTSVVYKATCNDAEASGVVSRQPQNTNSGPLRAVFDLGLDSSGQEPQFIDFEDFDTLEALDDPAIIEIGSGLYYFEYEFPVPGSPTTTEIVYVASSPVANPLSMDVDTGPIAGGTTVTITGTNFDDDCVSVAFGDDEATLVSATSTEIVVTSPAHDAGEVAVTVTNCATPPATVPAGFTYTAPSAIADGLWRALVFGGGVLSTVGESYVAGTVEAVSSDLAVTWGAGVPTSGRDLKGVAWNGSVFCAVGGQSDFVSGYVITSPDGVAWTQRTIPAGEWQAILWDGSQFVAVGTDAGHTTGKAATSSDGITWTSRTMPAGNWQGIAWNGSAYVAVGVGSDFTTGKAATSPDGVTWTSRTIPNGNYLGVSWNGAVFAVVGPRGDLGAGVAATSPDGITWTSRTIVDGYWSGVSWSGSVFLAAGCDLGFSTGLAVSSADGITWTSHAIDPLYNWLAVAWDGVSAFVAVGTIFSGTVGASTRITP